MNQFLQIFSLFRKYLIQEEDLDFSLSGNVVISSFIKNNIFFELRYISNIDFNLQILIDDVWTESNRGYCTFQKIPPHKQVYYLCHPDIKIGLEIFELKSELIISEYFKQITKHFYRITDYVFENLSSAYSFISHQNIVSIPLKRRIQHQLSIVTTVFNNSFFLEQTIQSVINQTNQNFEFIIKDAGSQDTFIEIVEKYKDYISLIIVKSDRGVYYGMDEGIRLSTSEYFQCLNSDDVLAQSDIINSILDTISNNNCDAVAGNILFYKDKTLKLEKSNLKKLKHKMSLYHPTLFMKKSDYLKVGGFDFKYKIAADLDLIFKMIKTQSSFYILDKTITIFRIGGASSAFSKTIKEELNIRWNNNKTNFIGYFYILLRTINYVLKKTKNEFFKAGL